MYLKAEPLTSAAFLPYGEVIECPAMPGRTYFEDAMASLRPKARPSISLIVAEPRTKRAEPSSSATISFMRR